MTPRLFADIKWKPSTMATMVEIVGFTSNDAGVTYAVLLLPDGTLEDCRLGELTNVRQQEERRK